MPPNLQTDRARHVLIVGGGLIGYASAYYLLKDGHQVTILDRRGAEAESCSTHNAGMIVPSHFIPLAAPGMIKLGLKWMFNPESPFYIRPRPDIDLANWCWKFYRASRREPSRPGCRDQGRAAPPPPDHRPVRRRPGRSR